MILSKLFEMQRKLDERIMEEHPELKGQNNLDWKILALQVELGECANEWRGFKKWSHDQEPRYEYAEPCFECGGKKPCIKICHRCDGEGIEYKKYPLLEEYVDCLHFILSIGLELEIPEIYGVEFENIYCGDEPDITNQFLKVKKLALLDIPYTHAGKWNELFIEFVCLGQMLGFTWEQIEEAYLQKNAVNHQRQESGY